MNAPYAKLSNYAFINIQEVIRRDGGQWKDVMPWFIHRTPYKAIWRNWLAFHWQKTLYGLRWTPNEMHMTTHFPKNLKLKFRDFEI